MGDSALLRPSPIEPTAAQSFDSYLAKRLWSLSFMALSANVCYNMLINLVSNPARSSLLSLEANSSLIFLNHMPKSVLVWSKSLLFALPSISIYIRFWKVAASKSEFPFLRSVVSYFLNSSIAILFWYATSSILTVAFSFSSFVILAKSFSST